MQIGKRNQNINREKTYFRMIMIIIKYEHQTFNSIGVNSVVRRFSEILAVVDKIPRIALKVNYEKKMNKVNKYLIIKPNITNSLDLTLPNAYSRSTRQLGFSCPTFKIRVSRVSRSCLLLGHSSKNASPISLKILHHQNYSNTC